MSKKSKRKKKLLKKVRNLLVPTLFKYTGQGIHKDKRLKRKNKKSWQKIEIENND